MKALAGARVKFYPGIGLSCWPDDGTDVMKLARHIQALRKDGDSEAVTALIDELVQALNDIAYDDAKSLAENEEALSDVLALFAGRVKSQRHAERQAELNKQPCSLCGEHHTGSLLENFIGVIHGIIWIMTCVALIAV